MEESIVKKIDEIILAIKVKGDKEGFTYTDAKVILCLEIMRLEFSMIGEPSTLTARAIIEIGSMDARQSYRGIFPNIFKLIQSLKNRMRYSEPKFLSEDLGIIGFRPEKWQNYFGGAIRNLFDGIRDKEGWGDKNKKRS